MFHFRELVQLVERRGRMYISCNQFGREKINREKGVSASLRHIMGLTRNRELSALLWSHRKGCIVVSKKCNYCFLIDNFY